MASVNELLKLLKEDGWYLFRNGANHDLYRHPTKEGQIPVPRHGSKEMAKGTLNSILKQAGLR
ncbi:type II toxin-antitoxin system HicA family toxin [Flavobacterium cupreum]|uniref:Type II toxin-antitoxin system HicA family toxin n=1 Tax=Flavobacterium cupreum TaxID=2133766 RepID=A0A434A2T1_9FLAO|nr:type II toxin-antitoxin system HicA family toxin [Flavobacterium cupreum]RUT68701.1 type II toxin-antitoxin system HicA family toxin [Flavobacterium cupreum]